MQRQPLAPNHAAVPSTVFEVHIVPNDRHRPFQALLLVVAAQTDDTFGVAGSVPQATCSQKVAGNLLEISITQPTCSMKMQVLETLLMDSRMRRPAKSCTSSRSR